MAHREHQAVTIVAQTEADDHFDQNSCRLVRLRSARRQRHQLQEGPTPGHFERNTGQMVVGQEQCHWESGLHPFKLRDRFEIHRN